MAEPASPARIAGTVALWVLRVLLAAYFVYSGYLLLGDGLVGKFDKIGLGQWLRYLTGVLEVAGAVGLLVPRLGGLAALGLAGVMAGAVATELFLLRDTAGAQLPATLLALAAVVAVFRWPDVTGALRLLRPASAGTATPPRPQAG
ncbi:DoxX family protein [Crossiella sp. SN42]|uniref:DoxX family protein n=1 Tax=Crossiella sp. SN42 TaxID=2944808 RepID=UPI00207C4A2C|nr:DoxX family protein [Crossiella sp. SN42]MCO1575642.1 DoxX family protein [Crossiella sp. SN42]